MAQREQENKVRLEALNAIKPVLEELHGEVMKVRTLKGGSPDNFSWVCPCVFDDGTEAFVKVDVSIPRGERIAGGYAPYDGYAEAESFAAELEEMNQKAAQRAAKAQQAEQEKLEKKKARAAKYAAKHARHS